MVPAYPLLLVHCPALLVNSLSQVLFPCQVHLVQPMYLLPCPSSVPLVLQDIRVQEAQEQWPMHRHQLQAYPHVLPPQLDYCQLLAIPQVLVMRGIL